MRGKNAREIPYPETTAEAHDAFQALTALFGNGEDMSFDLITCSDDEDVSRMRIAVDELNDMIIIFTFNWSKECAKDRAVDDFSWFHLDKSEARAVADVLRYFSNLIKDE